MNASDKDIETLKDFFGGYFHQDWIEEAPNSEGVVAKYLESAPTAEIARVHDALIRYAIDEDLGLNQGRKLHPHLNCCYLPTAGGLSVAQWVRRVADQLATKASDQATEED